MSRLMDAIRDAIPDLHEMEALSAASRGYLKVVKNLVEVGVNINKPQQYAGNATLIYMACREGHFDVVRYLLTRGADVTQVCTMGWSPIGVAAFHGHVEIVKYLFQYLGPDRVADCLLNDERFSAEIELYLVVQGPAEWNKRLECRDEMRSILSDIFRDHVPGIIMLVGQYVIKP